MGIQARVLVVGGGSIERSLSGAWVTKAPLASYLHDLADRFGHCTWIAERSGTWGIDLPNGSERFEGRIDPSRVAVVPMEGRVRSAPTNCFLLIRHALRRPYAIVFLPAALTMVPVLPVLRFLSKRMVVYLAGDYRKSLEQLGSQKWPGWSWCYKWAFRAWLAMANVVIARGRYLALLARESNPCVEEAVPLGHMKPQSPPPPRDLTRTDSRRILYLGLLVESKGAGILLRAVRALIDRHPRPHIQVDLLGDGPDRSAMEALCAELRLCENVVFHGWVEDSRGLEAAFAESHVVAVPSSTHPEGVPRVIDEAVVRGVPVVATRLASICAEFEEEEILLVDPGDPEALANGLEKVLFDPDVHRRLIDAAAERSRRWMQLESAAEQHARILLEEP